MRGHTIHRLAILLGALCRLATTTTSAWRFYNTTSISTATTTVTSSIFVTITVQPSTDTIVLSPTTAPTLAPPFVSFSPPPQETTRTSALLSTSNSAQGTSMAPEPSSSPCVDGRASLHDGRSYQLRCDSDTSVPAFKSLRFHSGGVTACIEHCNKTPGCTGWTWVPSEPGGTCYFKNSDDIVFYDAPGFIGGILVSATAPTAAPTSSSRKCFDQRVQDSAGRWYNVRCGKDTSVASSSSRKFDAGTYLQCIISCGQTSGCTGWTWVPGNHHGGTCYFKSGEYLDFYDAHHGYVGGILAGHRSISSTTRQHPTHSHASIHSKTPTSTSSRRPVQIPYPTPTQTPDKSQPLTCGLKEYLDRGPGSPPGFSVCQGRNAIGAFCSLDLSQYAGPVIGRPDLTISPLYFNQSDYSGILITREGFLPEDECDHVYKPDPQPCGPGCNPQCFAILNRIMNSCQTGTTTNKIGGYRAVGCQQWGIFSVMNFTGMHNWKVPDYNEQRVESCPD